MGNALKNCALLENIYMEQFEGYVSREKPAPVFKLQKTFYGLKPDPRQWLPEIDTFLLNEPHIQRYAYVPCFHVL